MATTVGYVKDLLASFMFLFCILYIVKNKRVQIQKVIILLVMAFIVDALFTVNSSWHCEDWKDSQVSKYIILLQIPIFVSIMFYSDVSSSSLSTLN
jgi:uncharacterized membrane protein YczE